MLRVRGCCCYCCCCLLVCVLRRRVKRLAWRDLRGTHCVPLPFRHRARWRLRCVRPTSARSRAAHCHCGLDPQSQYRCSRFALHRRQFPSLEGWRTSRRRRDARRGGRSSPVGATIARGDTNEGNHPRRLAAARRRPSEGGEFTSACSSRVARGFAKTGVRFFTQGSHSETLGSRHYRDGETVRFRADWVCTAIITCYTHSSPCPCRRAESPRRHQRRARRSP